MKPDTNTPMAGPSARSGDSCCGHGAREATEETRPPVAAEKPVADRQAAAAPETARAQTTGAKSRGCCCGG